MGTLTDRQIDALWEFFNTGQVNSKIDELLESLFGGPAGQSFKKLALGSQMDKISAIPEGLVDPKIWDLLFKLICAYDTNFLQVFTCKRFVVCGGDTNLCLVFNMFAYTLVQISVSERYRWVGLVRQIPGYLGGADLAEVSQYSEQFRAVCTMYAEVFSG